MDWAPADLLVVQSTPFCNIDCSYCYLGNRADRSRMTADTVHALARFLHDVPAARTPLPTLWHAGEPLAAPIAFYQEAFEYLRDEQPIPLQHHFQTNGTLIDDAWCAFIKRWSVRIGVSIDGPKWLHDAHRVNRAGHGTFDRAMRGIGKLREHGIPFSVLAVVTAESLGAAEEIWTFFASLGTRNVAFNVEEDEAANAHSSLEPAHRAAFKQFLARIADLQSRDPAISVREFESMRRHLSSSPGAGVLRSDNRPGAILNVDIRGNVTTFSPELLGVEHPSYGTFTFGNVHTDRWRDLMANPRFRAVHADIAAGVERCRESCPYFSVCGGGCPSNKLAEHQTFATAETQFCRFHVQTVADVMIERLEQEHGLEVV